MKYILRLLGVTYFMSPSGNIVIRVGSEAGTKVYVRKLYVSRIGRILAKIL